MAGKKKGRASSSGRTRPSAYETLDFDAVQQSAMNRMLRELRAEREEAEKADTDKKDADPHTIDGQAAPETP